MIKPARIRQRVRYLNAPDGTHLAWAESGTGPTVVKAAHWLTHLEYEWENPAWNHWIRFFSEHWRFVRYDERGCGLSGWQGSGLKIGQWVDDLESVIDAARPEGPVTLLGISQGVETCIQYAVRHPERVERMILYGGSARGGLRRSTPEMRVAYQALADLARVAWAHDNPIFRQVFTSRFFAGGTAEQLQRLNDLCLRAIKGEVVAELLQARGVVDITALLRDVRVPTLVIHARDDEVIPIVEGRLVASGIPAAEFVELDSRNHIVSESEPAWQRVREAVCTFLRVREQLGNSAFAALSARERQVLALMAGGLSNIDIAGRLNISEKTARNHASNLFDKLGVRSRAQAIVFARDRGFDAHSGEPARTGTFAAT
jgi:pimeloyl-ACP methyl ester carboxylesterase/DNA-binding CsgD family transcriptional regulator